jgi:hypothetical protein
MKPKPSKLDPYAERLTEMLRKPEEGGEGKTLAEAREQLVLDGCKVALSTLADWWERRRSELQQEKLLRLIGTGAQQVKEVQVEFEANPAPELGTIIKLHRLIAFQLATMGASNPEMLEAGAKMTKTVLDFVKEEGKSEDRKLAREKFEKMEARLNKAKEITTSEQTAEQKEARMKELFGM